MFEVATDTDFTTKVYARAGVPAGEGGRTSVQIDRLDLGRAYYWRAKADDGANSSLFATAQFEVLPKPFVGAPGLVAPVNGDRAASRRPTLTVNNADRNAAVGGSTTSSRSGRTRVSPVWPPRAWSTKAPARRDSLRMST